ncbi:hypothetical protein ID866_12905 [Astraeus odoratus]|nr:hypothetical protein ID866_12905 [Astraeus odoratus]
MWATPDQTLVAVRSTFLRIPPIPSTSRQRSTSLPSRTRYPADKWCSRTSAASLARARSPPLWALAEAANLPSSTSSLTARRRARCPARRC